MRAPKLLKSVHGKQQSGVPVRVFACRRNVKEDADVVSAVLEPEFEFLVA